MVRYRVTALGFHGRNRNAATFEEAEMLARRQCADEPAARFQIDQQETRAHFKTAWYDSGLLATVQRDADDRIWTDLTPRGALLL